MFTVLTPIHPKNWAFERKLEDSYDRVVASWRALLQRKPLLKETATNKYENE